MNNNVISVIENEMKMKNVLVLGDIMLDEYIIGKVERISPEAPIPVLDYKDNKKVYKTFIKVRSCYFKKKGD